MKFDVMETSLKGKTALVTGASSGIGEATTWLLAKNGVHVNLCGRRAHRLSTLANLIKTDFPDINVKCFAGDVRDKNYLQTLRNDGACDVDIFINNAGLARGVEQVANAKLDDWFEMIDTNLTAAATLSQFVVQQMLTTGVHKEISGHVVFTGSIAGHYTYEGGSVYAATKHALRAFAKTLREETCDKKIKVTTISPGMVDTEFSLVRLRDETKAKTVYDGMTPLYAIDIARQIVFALTQPAHVNLDEIVVMPTVQGAIRKVHRVSNNQK